jgi:low affinity Fe/Cu permease
MDVARAFSHFATATAKVVGKPQTFVVCVALVVLWAVTGPFFRFSDTWQLIINTATTVLTFLVVFLIQNTQNRDAAAIQAKLDELIVAGRAENRFVGIEHLTDRELEKMLAEVESYAQKLERERHGRRAGRYREDKPAGH